MYHQNYYKLNGTDLSRQTNTSIPQQINFRGKSEEYDGATMFFVSKKQQKTILNFSLDSLIVTEYYNIITEHQKISNFLNEANDSEFVTKKWSIVMINQMQIKMKEMKLSIIQKF